MPIEPLGLRANQWQFLNAPDKYVKASTSTERKLVPGSTRRQFRTARDILARLNGSYGAEAIRGILLADDVGLGKTTVAALVAWVVVSAGEKRRVRILAPNDVMMRRWEEELKSHVDLIKHCAPHLSVSEKQIKVGKSAVSKLFPGAIQVVKHSYAASDFNLSCDLLIVDEAHRAKGENTVFSKALRRQKRRANRVLILTATPFSIRLDELQRMLQLIGSDVASGPVKAFSRALDALYRGNTARSADIAAERLARKASAAVDALSPFVIRHGIDDLKGEQKAFGLHKDWNIHVAPASAKEVELMLRMDRALRIDKTETRSSKLTNDPRFHVGWRHYDIVREDLENRTESQVVEHHLNAIANLRNKGGPHSKMLAVGEQVKKIVEDGEKVILFCHHHATAQELTAHIDSVLPRRTGIKTLKKSVWREVWDELLDPVDEEDGEYRLRTTFINWLCSDPIRAQTSLWIDLSSPSKTNLKIELRQKAGRYKGTKTKKTSTIAEAAQHLYHSLLQSRSSRAVLSSAEYRLDLLPGSVSPARVRGVCTPSNQDKEDVLFIYNQQPDTIISIFNSPFGPDVLVVTDKLSEGIDLHRYCRHLIHYELDPSPIRTVQRNGRLRRVNSWASITDQPIRYAYPAFRGTRDFRLVQIMKKRIDSFSLLLGGVQDFDVEEIVGVEEQWRNEVITKAKARLVSAGGRLRARAL